MIAQATLELLGRYRRVFAAAWKIREQLAPKPRGALEREFLPAALEVQESPPHPLPRVLMMILIAAFAFTLAWASLGRIDTVASAAGSHFTARRVTEPVVW